VSSTPRTNATARTGARLLASERAGSRGVM
jgi:hypothetical protein